MKIEIELQKFFKDAKIDYKEDLYEDIYSDWRKYTIDEIIDALPVKYKYTAEDLQNDDMLFDSLQRAFNRAEELALVDACYNEQENAVEKYADKMVGYINQVQGEILAGDEVLPDPALKSIVIDWKEEKAIIDVNIDSALETTKQIINGEGMFWYDNRQELENQGKDKKDALTSHLHYFLNIKLIDDIYGMIGKPRFDWECDYGNVTTEILTEAVDNELSEYQANEDAKKDNFTDLLAEFTSIESQFLKYCEKYITKKDIKDAINRNFNSIKSIIKNNI